MENSLAEIYAIDLPLTYQHGFVYIRQLAVQLRKAMTEKTKVRRTLLHFAESSMAEQLASVTIIYRI